MSPSERGHVRKNTLSYETPDVRLEVEALNSGLYRDLALLTIYPLWQNVKGSHPADLHIFMRIEPRSAGLTLDPARITYLKPGGEPVGPRCARATGVDLKVGEERLSWCAPEGREAGVAPEGRPRPIRLDGPLAVNLLYPVDADPVHEFSIAVGGILKGGQPVHLPRIDFEREKFKKYYMVVVNE